MKNLALGLREKLLKNPALPGLGRASKVNGDLLEGGGGSGGVTSWNDLQNRPFGEEKTVIEWDGVIGDRVCATIGDMVFFAKVADVTIPKAALDGAKVTMIANGETQESVIAESFVEDKAGLLFVGGGAICVVENPGTYKVALMGGRI